MTVIIHRCDVKRDPVTGNIYGEMVVENTGDADNKPTRIIFNDPCTICFFDDGSKVISRCGKREKYEPEHGVMACIVKKLYGSRQAFIKAVAKGKNQQEVK